MAFNDAIHAQSATLAQRLIEKSWTISTAESCTGGGIACAITELAGSSAYFNQGFVTYSNEAKAEMLAVSTEDLASFGAVSQQVVAKMATSAMTLANANIAISVSGIAGPGGGTELKPVGTVWFAFAYNSANIATETFDFWQLVRDPDLDECIEVNVEQQDTAHVLSVCCRFSGDRNDVRQQAIEFALKQAVKLSK